MVNKAIMRYWAIRMGKYIEIRRSIGRPKTLISTYTRPVSKTIDKYVNTPNGKFHAGVVTTMSKVTLKQIVFVGGRVMGLILLEAHDGLLPIKDNSMKEMSGFNARKALKFGRLA